MTRGSKVLVLALGVAACLSAPHARAQFVVGGSQPDVEVNWSLLDKLGPEPTLPQVMTRKPAPPPKPVVSAKKPVVYKPLVSAPDAPKVPKPVKIAKTPAESSPTPVKAAPVKAEAPKPEPVIAAPAKSDAVPTKPAKTEVADAVPSKAEAPKPAPVQAVKAEAPSAVQFVKTPEPPAAPIPLTPAPPPVPVAKAPEPPAPPPVPVVKAPEPPAPPPVPVVKAPEPPAPPPVPVVKAPEPPVQVAAVTTSAAPAIIRKGDNASVAFQAGSSHVPGTAHSDLERIAQRLEKDESLGVQLLAYAAGDEANASNARRLSLTRAMEVRKFLMEMGVRSARVDLRALGNKIEGSPADRVDVVLVPR